MEQTQLAEKTENSSHESHYDFGTLQAIKVYESLSEISKKFFAHFHEVNLCFRCIFMLFKETSLQIYRLETFEAFRLHVGLPENQISQKPLF